MRRTTRREDEGDCHNVKLMHLHEGSDNGRSQGPQSSQTALQNAGRAKAQGRRHEKTPSSQKEQPLAHPQNAAQFSGALERVLTSLPPQACHRLDRISIFRRIPFDAEMEAEVEGSRAGSPYPNQEKSHLEHASA